MPGRRRKRKAWGLMLDLIARFCHEAVLGAETRDIAAPPERRSGASRKSVPKQSFGTRGKAEVRNERTRGKADMTDIGGANQ